MRNSMKTTSAKREARTELETTTQQMHAQGTLSMQELVEFNTPLYWVLRKSLMEWNYEREMECKTNQPAPIDLERTNELEKILGYKPGPEKYVLAEASRKLNSPRFVPLAEAQGKPYADDSIPSRECAAAVVEAASVIPPKDTRSFQATDRYGRAREAAGKFTQHK